MHLQEWNTPSPSLARLTHTVSVYAYWHAFVVFVRRSKGSVSCCGHAPKALTLVSALGGDILTQWLDAIEPFHSLMAEKDLRGIKKIHWMRENPMPRVSYKEDGTRRSRKIGKNWKKFMYWVEAWDDFCEGLE